jgi:hypothetical protein
VRRVVSIAWLAGAVLFTSAPAQAFTPADYAGNWLVKRVVGANDVVSSVNPHKPLGTKVRLTDTTATTVDGTCKFGSAAVQTISNDRLEKFLWGGQRIAGLDLPRRQIESAFGRAQSQVYYDGGKGCLEAVMLDRDHIVFEFQNGYIYLLDRVKRVSYRLP